MSIEQIADDWYAAVQRYCVENGIAYLCTENVCDYVAKIPCTMKYGTVRGMAVADEKVEYEKHRAVISRMGGKDAIALYPELTINGRHPASNLVAGTYNLRLVVLNPLDSVVEHQ